MLILVGAYSGDWCEETMPKMLQEKLASTLHGNVLMNSILERSFERRIEC